MIKFLQFIKYFAVSLTALSIDYSTYIILINYKNIEIAEAAVIGYFVGFIFSYFLFSKVVFNVSNVNLTEKVKQIFLYLLSGFLGLAMTYVITSLSVLLIGNNIHMAKIIAVIISFIVVYLFRKYIVFKQKTEEFE